MSWDEGLFPDQIAAASHVGTHARLLAGPGTGKTLTLTRRVMFLVEELGINPRDILVLTFTRAAAAVLRNEIRQRLEELEMDMPRVSTLHSFALRQIVRNQNLVTVLPQPLRIADDWEEKNIIEPDLRRLISSDVRTVRRKFQQLSADWESLAAEEDDWERLFPDPRFLGAWRQHREIYGYTMRSELVYQLKRALEQIEDFSLESDFNHILIDEYQDLNKCDLAVVQRIIETGAELFVSGDDDQSIYGFRGAHPLGIRQFCEEYNPSTPLELETCHRCDNSILETGLYVANLDPQRIEKPLVPRDDAEDGVVRLLRFHHENHEASGVAEICNFLLAMEDNTPEEVLILVRSDWNGAFSNLLCQCCEDAGVPVGINVEETGPLDIPEGRMMASVLRLSLDSGDSLAYRTLLLLRENGLGEATFNALYQLANGEGTSLRTAADVVAHDTESTFLLRRRLTEEHHSIERVVADARDSLPIRDCDSGSEALARGIQGIADRIIESEDTRELVVNHLLSVMDESSSSTVAELIGALSASVGDVEQELLEDKVNIMTMHKAKGLTANAVIIVAAEDQLIPGTNLGAKEGDERRLLYVSLTRARHHLYVSYCTHRYGAQRFSGRDRGRSRHSLTRFLQDGPLRPLDGRTFTQGLQEND